MREIADAAEITTKALSLVPQASRFQGDLANSLQLHQADYAKAIFLYKNEPLGFIKETGQAIAYNKLGQQGKAQQLMD